MPNVLGKILRPRKYVRGAASVRNKSYEICVCGNNKKVFTSNDGCMTSSGAERNETTSIDEVCSE